MDNNKPLTPPRALAVGEQYCMDVEVYLNGVKQDKVTAYNQDEGWIDRYITENGKLKIFGDSLKIKRLKGDVEPRWIKEK